MLLGDVHQSPECTVDGDAGADTDAQPCEERSEVGSQSHEAGRSVTLEHAHDVMDGPAADQMISESESEDEVPICEDGPDACDMLPESDDAWTAWSDADPDEDDGHRSESDDPSAS